MWEDGEKQELLNYCRENNVQISQDDTKILNSSTSTSV